MKSALFRSLLNFQGKETKIQYISTKTSRTELYWKKSNQDFGIFATLTHFLMMTAFQRTYWQCFLFFIMLHQGRIKHNFLTTKCLYYLRVSQIYICTCLNIMCRSCQEFLFAQPLYTSTKLLQDILSMSTKLNLNFTVFCQIFRISSILYHYVFLAIF